MKKFLIFTLTILTASLLASCNLNDDEVDSVVAGDIILKDNTTVHVAKYDEYDEENPPIGIVAFIGDGTVGTKDAIYGMGLEFGSNLTWVGVDSETGTAVGNGTTTNFVNIYCTPSSYSATSATFTGDTDGSDNFAEIKNITEVSSGNYPLFEYAESYTAEDVATGWYIPTVAEISYLFRNLSTIQKTITALKEVDKDNISTPSFSDTDSDSDSSTETSSPKTFWTSSIPYKEFISKDIALCVTFNSSGDIASDTKTTAHSTLVIRKFETD